MPFADRPQAQDEPASPVGNAGLVGMADDAGIEQRRCFEGVFVQEIGADQAALRLAEARMRLEGVFHFGGARIERIEQVAMPAFEILEHVGQLLRCGFRIEAENPVDDMIGAGLVGAIEVSRFGRGLEGADDDARRIGAQIERLAIEEHRLRHLENPRKKSDAVRGFQALRASVGMSSSASAAVASETAPARSS